MRSLLARYDINVISLTIWRLFEARLSPNKIINITDQHEKRENPIVTSLTLVTSTIKQVENGWTEVTNPSHFIIFDILVSVCKHQIVWYYQRNSHLAQSKINFDTCFTKTFPAFELILAQHGYVDAKRSCVVGVQLHTSIRLTECRQIVASGRQTVGETKTLDTQRTLSEATAIIINPTCWFKPSKIFHNTLTQTHADTYASLQSVRRATPLDDGVLACETNVKCISKRNDEK